LKVVIKTSYLLKKTIDVVFKRCIWIIYVWVLLKKKLCYLDKTKKGDWKKKN